MMTHNGCDDFSDSLFIVCMICAVFSIIMYMVENTYAVCKLNVAKSMYTSVYYVYVCVLCLCPIMSNPVEV
jgi:hypothetical protein